MILHAITGIPYVFFRITVTYYLKITGKSNFECLEAIKEPSRLICVSLQQPLKSPKKMGWWWKSSPPKDRQQDLLQNSKNDGSKSDSNSTSVPPPTLRTLTADEQAEADLKRFFASLEVEENKRSHPDQASFHPSSSPSASPEVPSTAPTEPAKPAATPGSIAPDSLYPDTMSCRSAFDYAFFCQSFGGQFVNVYRYGELRSCSEHWDNFWLCMKTRASPEEEKRKAIRDHNRKKAIKYKTGPSSEDVWDLRTEPARDAFTGDFAAFERMRAEAEGTEKPSL